MHLRGVGTPEGGGAPLKMTVESRLLAWDLQVDVKLFSYPQRAPQGARGVHLLYTCWPLVATPAVRRENECDRAGTSSRPLEGKSKLMRSP